MIPLTIESGLIAGIAICVVLPIMIVWLVTQARRHEIDKKSEIMIKAIEAGTPIDVNLLKAPQKARTVKQVLLKRLTGASITSLMGTAFLCLGYFITDTIGLNEILPFFGFVLLSVGIGLFISYFVGRKFLAKEIEAEEKTLSSSGK